PGPQGLSGRDLSSPYREQSLCSHSLLGRPKACSRRLRGCRQALSARRTSARWQPTLGPSSAGVCLLSTPAGELSRLRPSGATAGQELVKAARGHQLAVFPQVESPFVCGGVGKEEQRRVGSVVALEVVNVERGDKRA